MTPELIVDSFAGGGGASEGIRRALGRGPDLAINHDAEAIALHAANHPESKHFQEDVWRVDPRVACGDQPVGLMWLSPDCKHFSKAKGGKPVSKKIRGLAWVAVRWAKAVKPRVIVLENVEEFQTWGPLLPNGRPCPARKGFTFRMFVGRLRACGYVVEWREMRACDYGAPTIRKRLFLVARCDGQPIVWPMPTHGRGRAQPWRTAAECIDWSITCPSIFTRKKPLAENTQRRIARGLQRFVIDSPRPFIVPTTHHGDTRSHSISEPLRTITGAHRGEQALVAPFLKPRYGEDPDPSRRGGLGQAPRVRSLELPSPAIVPTGNGGDLVAAFLAKHQSERHANEVQSASLFDSLPTVKTRDSSALVTSMLVNFRGTDDSHLKGRSLERPLPTISAQGNHAAEVRAFLVAYYGNERDGGDLFDPMRTVTSKDRLGLVTIHGVDYQIVDVGMRMLAPRELYRAQGFGDDYKIDILYRGKPMTKTAQVRMCGNSVCPPLAHAIVAANYRPAQADLDRVA